MPPLPQPDIGEILYAAANFVYMVWLPLVVMALVARRHGLANAMAVWTFELLALIFITAYATSNTGLNKALRIIPEPWNTYLFLMTGLLLLIALFIRRSRRSARRV